MLQVSKKMSFIYQHMYIYFLLLSLALCMMSIPSLRSEIITIKEESSSNDKTLPENLVDVDINNKEILSDDLDIDSELGNDEEGIFSLRGEFKELFTHLKTDQYSLTGKRKRLVADLKRIRLSPELKITEAFLLHIDYDNEIISGSYLKSIEFDNLWIPSDYNELFDLSWQPYYSKDLYYRTKLHRAYAKIIIKDLILTIGRQQIRFGSGRLWNPLDILNPISPIAIEGATEQKGTDALRLEYYLNESTEIAIVYDQKSKDNKGIKKLTIKNSNVISRFKTTVYRTDFALMGGRVSRRNIVGSDIAAILFDGMVRGSLIYSDPEDGMSFFQGSGGYEYNFRIGLYFLLEYFYNQNGLNFNDNLKLAYAKSLISGIDEDTYHQLSNQFLTYNQHYIAIAIGYDITPLFRVDIFSIYDFQGKGLFITPNVKYNPLENIDINIGLMLGHLFKNSRYDSDFEHLDKYSLLYASIIWYF